MNNQSKKPANGLAGKVLPKPNKKTKISSKIVQMKFSRSEKHYIKAQSGTKTGNKSNFARRMIS
jgi:hypothetical protein